MYSFFCSLSSRQHGGADFSSQTNRTALVTHQERSGPVMDQLHRWLEAQFPERKTEPNSGLGKAITYLLRHWRPLTPKVLPDRVKLFWHLPGRPAGTATVTVRVNDRTSMPIYFVLSMGVLLSVGPEPTY
jgi:hypothetical protein